MSIATTRIARTVGAVLVAGAALLTTAGTASADSPVDDPAAGTTLTFSGAQNGPLAGATTACLGEGYYQVTGELHGSPVELFVTFSQGDPGVGAFPLDVGLDPGHGLTTLTVDDQNYVSDSGGENTGTFTVDPDGQSGALDVRTSTSDQTEAVEIHGTWTCS